MLKYFQPNKLTTKKTENPNIVYNTYLIFPIKCCKLCDVNCVTYFLTDDFYFTKGHNQIQLHA